MAERTTPPMNNQILLADDDPLLHRVVGFKLAQNGWKVISAYDGAEALKLRRDPQFAWTPVLMLSARSREADVVGALDEGASDYLTKPFSPAELLARVARLIPEGAGA